MKASEELNVKGQSLEGRYVVIKQSFFGDSYRGSRIARVTGGPGCDPNEKRFRAVNVESVEFFGQGCPRLDRAVIERFANLDEIASAQSQQEQTI